MNKALIVVAAAAIAVAGIQSEPAQAGSRGGAVAAGVIGGLAAGAIIGSAIANSGPTYVAPAPVYAPPPPAYIGPSEVFEGGVCHIERQRVWVEGYGWRSRRIEVCD